MKSYRLAESAKRDLEQIIDYLGEQSPSAVANVAGKPIETFVLLGQPLASVLRAPRLPSRKTLLPKKIIIKSGRGPARFSHPLPRNRD